jgi:hypothetical protein
VQATPPNSGSAAPRRLSLQGWPKSPERLGEILEILGSDDHVRFRVRWDDDRESIFYPGSDATIRVHPESES